MVEVEFVKRVPINGFWLLPGTRAEFATAGQAGTYTVPGLAKLVTKKPPTKSKKRDDNVDADKESRTAKQASFAGRSKSEPAS